MCFLSKQYAKNNYLPIHLAIYALCFLLRSVLGVGIAFFLVLAFTASTVPAFFGFSAAWAAASAHRSFRNLRLSFPVEVETIHPDDFHPDSGQETCQCAEHHGRNSDTASGNKTACSANSPRWLPLA